MIQIQLKFVCCRRGCGPVLVQLRFWWKTGNMLSLNTLRPRQDGRHFADDLFKCIFMNENVWISIKISLKFVRKSPNCNIPALVQIMAWRRSGDKSLSEAMMVDLLTHTCVTRPQWVKLMKHKLLCLTRSQWNYWTGNKERLDDDPSYSSWYSYSRQVFSSNQGFSGKRNGLYNLDLICLLPGLCFYQAQMFVFIKRL